MNPPRIVRCDDEELRFDDGFLTPATLLIDVAMRTPWHWDHNGMVRKLPFAVMRNGIDVYLSYIRQRNRRVAVPRHAGRFTWDQTVPLEQPDQVADLGDSEAARGGESQD